LAFIVIEQLKRIELNSTTLYDPKNSVHPWASAEIFQGRKRRNFAYPFQVADDAVQMDVNKMLLPFYLISLCWLNRNFQSFVSNVFYTSAIINVSFHKLPNISIFFEHLYK